MKQISTQRLIFTYDQKKQAELIDVDDIIISKDNRNSSIYKVLEEMKSMPSEKVMNKLFSLVLS